MLLPKEKKNMRVVIKGRVFRTIRSFYLVAIEKHPTLDMATVLKKEKRLYDSLQSLGDTYFLYNTPRYIKEWQGKGYLDFICEDFHFAFKLSVLPS